MLAFVASALLALASPSPPPAGAASAPSTLSADAIFARARLEMYLRTYPRYVAYIIDVQSNALGKHYHEGYRALLRTHDSALVVHKTPIYTSNKPPNPYGFSFFGINPEGKPADHIDPPFGVPLMSATYDFDLSRGPASLRRSDDTSQGDLPPVIGTVKVTALDYAVTLEGVEDLDGRQVYHLRLQPLDEPAHNRVRELWVDTQTFDIRKLVTEGIFETGPPASAMWTVNFIQLHGHWFIRTESTGETLRTPGHLFSSGIAYQGVNYTFGAYEYPGYISDLEFLNFDLVTDAIQE